jgi:hypothetical protein
MEKTQILAYVLPVHALFNLSIALLFFFQASLGWKIRTRRKLEMPPSVKITRSHRKLGPLLVLAGIAGALSGMIIAFFAKGHIFISLFHGLTGIAIACTLVIIYYLSKKISLEETRWRGIHFRLGLLILCLYCAQIFIGIGIFF